MADDMQGQPDPPGTAQPAGRSRPPRPQADSGENVELIIGVVVDGSTITLAWNCGRDHDGVPYRKLRRVEVTENDKGVHLQVFSEAYPGHVRLIDRNSGYVVVSGESHAAETTIELGAPLGARAIYDDFFAGGKPIIATRQD